MDQKFNEAVESADTEEHFKKVNLTKETVDLEPLKDENVGQGIPAMEADEAAKPEGMDPETDDTEKPEGENPEINEAAKPEGVDPETEDTEKPEGRNPEIEDTEKPEGMDPETEDTEKPEGMDPETEDTEKPEGMDPETGETADRETGETADRETDETADQETGETADREAVSPYSVASREEACEAPEPEPEEEETGRGHRTAFWIALLAVLLILGGIYGYGYYYCGGHFMPGTRINGFDCSGMTAEEADDVFSRAAQEYVLNIRFRGGSTEMLNAEDMGFSYVPDGSTDALLQGQEQMLWPRYFFEDSDYTIELNGTTDADRLMQALQALPELQEENMEKPENAYIQFRDGSEEEDGCFEIVPDTEGSTIAAEELAAAAADAAARYEELIDAEQIEGVYQQAKVTKDNTKLVARCNDLNDIVGASITYVIPDGDKIRLNADVMKNWLVKDDEGKLVKDEDVWDEKLWEFLEMLAMNCNTLGMKRQFPSTLRGTITVSGGDYGYMVNQIVEHDLLVKDLAECKKETRTPSYYITPYNDQTENDGIGTSYIEVDLKAQHIWCYVNGELKMDSDCVSGNASDDHETPTGVFGIMFMKKNATLRGIMQKDGEYEYETKVGYWMPFYAECGFHDAWWRTEFGGDIYKKDGSHGCINLPVDAAEKLFKYCDEKMPVVVYK